MLWPPIILMGLAATALVFGLRITNGPGPGDQRAGGALYVVLGILIAILAVAWWAAAVTLKALG